MYYKIGENYLVDLEEETIFVFGIEGNKEETLAPEFWRTLHVLCQALKMLTAKEVEDKIQELFKWKSGKLVSKLVSVLRKEIFDSELLPKNRRNGAKEAVYGFTNIKKLSKDQFVQERDNLQHKYGESTQLITTTERLEKRIKQGNKVENSTLSNRLKVDGKFERRLNSLYIREELENIIEENFKRRTIQGLIGAPGTGKSCLALQYAYRKHITREYSKVLLLDCETRSSFLQSINLSENKGMDLELIAPQSIIEQFDVHDKKVLVIFDNLGFDQLLINTREMDTFCNTVRNIIIKLDEIQDGNIHILYTSREKKDLDSMPVCVDKFTEKQAGEFLKKGVSFQTKSDDLKKIIKNFGTLPIVLGTVVALGRAKGSYNKIKNINTYNSTLEEKTLLVLLKELFEELELSENGKNYVQLLKIASLLSPQFDRELLCSVAVKMGYTKEIFENCLDEYNDKVSILVEEENNRLQIHREYQQTIFGMLKPGEANLILKYIRETLESMMKWYQIFDYHFLQQMATIDTHIQKLFGLGLYEDMGQLFLISAFYNGFYLDYESKIFKQYFEWFQNRDDDFISAISLGEKAVIGIGNKKEQDSVKKGLYYYKNLFENELESKERNMVLIFLCYSIAEAEKRGGFKSNAIKVAEQGIEYIKKEKCSIETKRNVERLLALLQIQTMIYILKSLSP